MMQVRAGAAAILEHKMLQSAVMWFVVISLGIYITILISHIYISNIKNILKLSLAVGFLYFFMKWQFSLYIYNFKEEAIDTIVKIIEKRWKDEL
jgi:uncharacterized integral membrane protein